MDRHDIFQNLLRRQALRRASSLPLLNITAEYHRLIAVQEWKEICDVHCESVAEEILQEERAKYADWGNSWRGEMALHLTTVKALQERYGKRNTDSSTHNVERDPG